MIWSGLRFGRMVRLRREIASDKPDRDGKSFVPMVLFPPMICAGNHRMAAPLFSKAEVSRLLALKKKVPFEDWVSDSQGRDGPKKRPKLKAIAEHDGELIEFAIEIQER